MLEEEVTAPQENQNGMTMQVVPLEADHPWDETRSDSFGDV